MLRTDFPDRLKATLILFHLFIGSATLLYGQDVPYLKAYPAQEYEASPQNWSIQLLNRGIVAANSEGILTFDGEHWNLHPVPGNHQARSVLHFRDTIFCGSYGEFGFWVQNLVGTWEYSSLSAALDHPLTSQEEIWNIVAFPEGILFQSFSTIYLLRNGQISIVTPPYSTGIMFASWWKDAFYLQVIGQGLVRFDPKAEEFEMICGNEEIGNRTVVGIEGFGEKLLIATDTRGLFSYDGRSVRPFCPALTDVLSSNQLNKIAVEDSFLIMGTILDGVFVANQQGGIIEHLNHNSGLPDNTVLSLASAGNGRFWVGLDNGLAYVNLRAAYRKYRDQSAEIGVIFDAIEYQGALYLGTNHGLFRLSDQEDSPSTFEIVPGTQGQVWSLRQINGLLYCGHNSGTFQIGKDGVQLLSAVTGAWSWLPLENKNWIQGTYTGLVKVTREPDASLRFSKIPGFSLPIRDLVQDEDGWVWGVAPYKGLYRIKLSENHDSVVSVASNMEEWGLPDFNRLSVDMIDEKILINTDSGWFMLNQSYTAFDPVTTIYGMRLSREVQRVRQIGQKLIGFRGGTLEIFSDQGSQLIEVESVSNPPACKLMANGSILIGGVSQYILIDSHQDDLFPIQELEISSLSILRDQSKISLPLSGAHQPSEIALLPTDLGIEVAINSGITNEEQMYRFRINEKGDWSSWSNQASFSFPLISYGAHEISIQRKADFQMLTITCDKEAPWYVQGWAITLFILLFMAVNFAWIQAYQRRTARRWKKQQIERERARHAREIERKNQRLEADLEEQNLELAGITMNLVRKNEVILDMKEQLKELRKLDQKEAAVRVRQLQLKLNSTLSSEKDWEAFEYHFTKVHPGFFTGLKKDYPTLTSGDLRLSAYLRMNLSSKEIAPLLHITVRSLENRRYRLRKKLGLSPDQQIIDLLLSY